MGTNHKIVIQKRPGFPRDHLRPLILSVLHCILPAKPRNTITSVEAGTHGIQGERLQMTDPIDLTTVTPPWNKSSTYFSRMDLRGPCLAGPSESTGREKIPRARSMRRTTETVSSAARMRVKGEDLRPGSIRECRGGLAIVAVAVPSCGLWEIAEPERQRGKVGQRVRFFSVACRRIIK